MARHFPTMYTGLCLRHLCKPWHLRCPASWRVILGQLSTKEVRMRRFLFFVVVMTLFLSSMKAQDTKPTGPKPDRVQITPRVTEAQAGQQMAFSAVGYDAAGNQMDAKPTAWFATPGDTAYADEQGVVTFVHSGEVRVGALINGKQGFLTVMVKPQAVARIDIQVPATPISVGTGIPLAAVTRMSNGDPRTDLRVAWSSLNPSIAIVDESGFVTGVAPGTATIQATADNVKATARLEVIRNPVRSLAVEPTTVK